MDEKASGSVRNLNVYSHAFSLFTSEACRFYFLLIEMPCFVKIPKDELHHSYQLIFGKEHIKVIAKLLYNMFHQFLFMNQRAGTCIPLSDESIQDSISLIFRNMKFDVFVNKLHR